MLPFHGVPVARRGCLSWLQLIERRPVMDDPGSLLPGHHSHEATLNFELAVLTNQQKKVVSDRKRTVVVGRYKSQDHVTVTEVPLALPLPKRESPTICWARKRVSEAHRQRHGHAQ